MSCGFIFTAHTLGWVTPSPSHNTSTGPMSFLGGTPSPSHNTSTGPMSFLGGVNPSDWSQVPSRGVPQSQAGYPSPRGGTPVLGYPQSQDRMGTPLPNQDRMGYPPPPPLPRDRLCLDLLRCGRYASCGFPQEDCLLKHLCLVCLDIL